VAVNIGLKLGRKGQRRKRERCVGQVL